MLILMLIKSESTILNFFSILGNFLTELILKTCIFKTCNNRYKQEKKQMFLQHISKKFELQFCVFLYNIFLRKEIIFLMKCIGFLNLVYYHKCYNNT